MSPAVVQKLVVLLSAAIGLLGTLIMPEFELDPAYAHGVSLALLAWLLKPPGSPKPPSAPALPLLLLAVILAGCPMPNPDWPRYLECAPGINDIIATVSRVLLDGGGTATELKQRGRDELQDLAVTHGADVVACTISKLIADWRRPGATATRETLAAAIRGEHFLQSVGVDR